MRESVDVVVVVVVVVDATEKLLDLTSLVNLLTVAEELLFLSSWTNFVVLLLSGLLAFFSEFGVENWPSTLLLLALFLLPFFTFLFLFPPSLLAELLSLKLLRLLLLLLSLLLPLQAAA